MKQSSTSNVFRRYGSSVLKLLQLAFLGTLVLTHGSVAEPSGSGGGSSSGGGGGGWVGRLRGGGNSGGSSSSSGSAGGSSDVEAAGSSTATTAASPPYSDTRPYDTCVCAFDFDGVLRAPPPGAKDQDTPAPEAQRVVQACKDAGWEIAICSANDNFTKMKTVLGQRIDPTVFTPAFFDSSAFQMHYDDKSITLNNIIKYFDTHPQCVALFDDQSFNKVYADQTGAVFIQLPQNAGVTMDDFLRAQKAVGRGCNCASPQDRSYNTFSLQPPDRSYLAYLDK